MAKLFPDRYFHIGGDEVNGKEWDANPEIQKFMRAHGIKSNAELQAYFNKHVQAIVSKHGKIMMGWDEILSPDLPKSIVIQSWRGQASLAQAAQQGFSGLLSTGYYLDLAQSAAQHYARRSLVRSDRGPHAGRDAAHSRRRGLHVDGIRFGGKHRFAHLAASRRHRRALVVSAERHRRGFHVPPHGGGEPSAGRAWV